MRPSRSSTSAAVAVGCALAIALSTPAVACVAPDRDGPTQAVEVVLDASGSMRGPDDAGDERFATATRVVGRFVNEVPSSVALGLRVYGHRVPVGDAEAGCRDSEQLVEVAPVDREALRDALGALTPRGYTPIGRTLRQAADALPEASTRRILLVSDGIDSCQLPPCDVARDIADASPDVVVDTVGFTVPEAQADELRCIARATGGVYTEAGDARTLFRALRSYLTSGEPVTGGDQPADATPVRQGQYVDRLPLDGQRWYRIDVEGLDELTASATLVDDAEGLPASPRRLSIEVRVPDVVGDLVCDEEVVAPVGVGFDHVAASYAAPPGTPGPCGEPGARLVGVGLADTERKPWRPPDEPVPPPPTQELEVVFCGATDVRAPASLGELPVVGGALVDAPRTATTTTFPPSPVLTGFATGLLATVLLAAARRRDDP